MLGSRLLAEHCAHRADRSDEGGLQPPACNRQSRLRLRGRSRQAHLTPDDRSQRPSPPPRPDSAKLNDGREAVEFSFSSRAFLGGGGAIRRWRIASCWAQCRKASILAAMSGYPRGPKKAYRIASTKGKRASADRRPGQSARTSCRRNVRGRAAERRSDFAGLVARRRRPGGTDTDSFPAASVPGRAGM